MSRWIALDRGTADAIRNLFVDDLGGTHLGDPVMAALELSAPSIVVLPSDTPGNALIAYFRPKASKMDAPRPSIAYEPTGFLGLSDTPVLEEDRPQDPKGHWWQRKKAS